MIVSKDIDRMCIKARNLLLQNILRPIPQQIAHCFQNFLTSFNKWRHPSTFHDKELLATILGPKNYNFPSVSFVGEELPWKIVANKCSTICFWVKQEISCKGEGKCSNSMLMKLLCEQWGNKKATTFCQIQFKTFETNCLESLDLINIIAQSELIFDAVTTSIQKLLSTA